ncbi:TetR/AcrR family transcriptional regulator [Scrofimicrobium canadense]|uniref:TetR/AcrR family transcriptional regulator n=1 Tax=Scrofimicrobium canadense TaxID=2652290 RepID=UPI00198002E9|nr:TetR/AcrR family transcriptional regulator [Scrofimicrobium canadense]
MRDIASLDSPRKHIVNGARQAFLTRGYDGASMRVMTDYTGYSQAGISHYFQSKSDLLIAVVEESSTIVLDSLAVDESVDDITALFKVWRTLTRHRDHVAVRTVVISEASKKGHPATDIAAETMNALKRSLTKRFPTVKQPQIFADIFEGLMKAWLYQPHLDGGTLLRDAHLALSTANETVAASIFTPETSEDFSYELERLTREIFIDTAVDADEKTTDIINAATEIFGQQGYIGGSLRDIASKVGISHPALLRRYHTKDDLLKAVLRRQPEFSLSTMGARTPREAAIKLVKYSGAAENIPGYIPLHTTLEARSFQPGTSHHAFAKHRFESRNALHNHIFSAIGDGGLIRSDLSAKHQSRIFQALRDGVYIRWTFDQIPGSTQLSLAHYLNLILVPPLTEIELASLGIDSNDLHNAS